jgi:hypothetical protein
MIDFSREQQQFIQKKSHLNQKLLLSRIQPYKYYKAPQKSSKSRSAWSAAHSDRIHGPQPSASIVLGQLIKCVFFLLKDEQNCFMSWCHGQKPMETSSMIFHATNCYHMSEKTMVSRRLAFNSRWKAALLSGLRVISSRELPVLDQCWLVYCKVLDLVTRGEGHICGFMYIRGS